MSLKTKIKKLKPIAGDIIVLSFSSRSELDSAYNSSKQLGQMFRQCQFLFVMDGTDINLISEKEMNKLGWYKK